MAQTKKIQEERKAEIESMGFHLPEDGNTFIHKTGMDISILKIVNFSKEDWRGLTMAVKKEIERIEAIPVTQSENVPHTESGIEISKRNAESDIAKFDFNKAKITEAGKVYMALSIASLTDKENHKKIKEAKSTMRTARTTLEKRRKELKDWYLVEGKKIDDYAKECFGMIEPIESHLDTELTKFDEWESAEEIRKEKERNAERDRRVCVLETAGMKFTGAYYSIGDNISMDIVTISTLDIAEFDKLVARVIAEKNRLDDIAEAARLAQIETDKEEQRKRDLFAKEQKDLKDAQDKIESDKKEIEKQKEEMKRAKLQMREALCKSVGLVLHGGNYVFNNDFANLIVTMQFLNDGENEAFAAEIDTISGKIADAKAKQIEKAESDRKEQERKDREAADLLAKQQKDEAEKQAMYLERQSQLVRLGMVWIAARGAFVVKNEFGDEAILSIEEMKATDSDAWPRVSLGIEEKINEVTRLTSTKRLKIEQDKEALKPEIQKVHEYILSIKAIEPPLINDLEINGILMPLCMKITSSCEQAITLLHQCE